VQLCGEIPTGISKKAVLRNKASGYLIPGATAIWAFGMRMSAIENVSEQTLGTSDPETKRGRPAISRGGGTDDRGDETSAKPVDPQDGDRKTSDRILP
jgi:hypothetical protein